MMDQEMAMHCEGLDQLHGLEWGWVEEELRANREPSAEDQVVFADLLDRLSRDARALALFFVDYPDEFRAWVGLLGRRTDCGHHKCCNCELLRRYLIMEVGWSRRALERALRELRKKLRAW